MWSGRFDPKEREVWVRARVHGPLGFWDVDAMLDIGTSTTIISAAVLDSLGYGAHMGKEIRHVVGPGGIEIPCYNLDVRLEVMGLDLISFEVLAQDVLPDQYGVEGLIGMDIVDGRILTINGKIGLVTLDE